MMHGPINIRFPYTYPASKITQKKIQLSRIKEEIKYLYKKILIYLYVIALRYAFIQKKINNVDMARNYSAGCNNASVVLPEEGPLKSETYWSYTVVIRWCE